MLLGTRKESIRLQTGQKRDIANEIDRAPPEHYENAVGEAQIKQYGGAARTGPCHRYNCHGLTFAARRTGLFETPDIQAILTDDGYKLVEKGKVLPGDIIVYRSLPQAGAEITHSGIVVEVQPDGNLRNPKVVSKWGMLHEVTHFASEGPYVKDSQIEYYRVVP